MWQASHTVLTALSSMGCSATQLYRGITHGSSAMRSVDGPAREPCIAPKTWQAPYPLGEATSKGPEICIGHQEIRSEIKQDFLDERRSCASEIHYQPGARFLRMRQASNEATSSIAHTVLLKSGSVSNCPCHHVACARPPVVPVLGQLCTVNGTGLG